MQNLVALMEQALFFSCDDKSNGWPRWFWFHSATWGLDSIVFRLITYTMFVTGLSQVGYPQAWWLHSRQDELKGKGTKTQSTWRWTPGTRFPFHREHCGSVLYDALGKHGETNNQKEMEMRAFC